ncbi:hypothetical protein MMPV_000009 [Pyropia vietnamensis]
MAAFVPGLPLATPSTPRATTFLGSTAVSTPPPSASASASRRVAATMVAAVGTPSKFERMRHKWGTPAMDESKGGMYEEFASALEGLSYNFSEGDIVPGVVQQLDPHGAMVDIGAKASAVCPTAEVCIAQDVVLEDVLALGDQREFQVIRSENADGELLLSIRRIEYSRAWARVAQLAAENVTVNATVESINRGGGLVTVEGLRAFLPGSHISVRRETHEDLVGMELPLKLIQVDPEEKKLVVSHRLAAAAALMTNLTTGAVVKGTVRSVKPYGAFVDIGGVSGLLHISQISHDHVKDIELVLSLGMEVKAYVMNQDKSKGRISLSTKVLEAEPGDMMNDPAAVFAVAEETAARYAARVEEERAAASSVADDIVSSLDIASLDDLGLGVDVDDVAPANATAGADAAPAAPAVAGAAAE